MFSQSLGPYISGDIDSNPSSNDIPATGTYSFDTKPLNMQSLLQPYYAPGIMYNTIKSGIAVDLQAAILKQYHFKIRQTIEYLLNQFWIR